MRELSNKLGKMDHADGMMVLASVVTIVHDSVLCTFLAGDGTITGTIIIIWFLFLNCLCC